MIKFFRKIRQNLLSEGKTGKYLKYALGEIILVVIGILIALQINNWDEKRLQKQALKNIYTIIVEDLKNDITDIDLILKTKKEREPFLTKVLDGLTTQEDYKNCIECQFSIVGQDDLAIETRGYNLLNNFDTSKIKTDSLTIKVVQFYKKQLLELSVDDISRGDDIMNTINYWKDNYNWYSDYITQRNTTGFIEYALNNQDYRNRTANYYLLNYTIYIPVLETFNSEAQRILEELEEKIKK